VSALIARKFDTVWTGIRTVTALAIPASLNPMARRWQSLSTHWPTSIHFRARMWNGHWNQLTCMASFKYLWRSTLRVSRRLGTRPELGYLTRYMLHVHKVIAAKSVDQTGILKHGEVHRVAHEPKVRLSAMSRSIKQRALNLVNTDRPDLCAAATHRQTSQSQQTPCSSGRFWHPTRDAQPTCCP